MPKPWAHLVWNGELRGGGGGGGRERGGGEGEGKVKLNQFRQEGSGAASWLSSP